MVTKINFVIPKTGKYSNYKLFKGDLDKEWKFLTNGQWAWIIQTYHRLNSLNNKFNLDITSSEIPLEDHINIIFVDDYLRIINKHKYYCIVTLLDRYVYYPGDLNIVQNKAHKLPFHSVFLPHWSQAGLLPNNSIVSSEQEFLRVGFFGLPVNSTNIVELLEGHYKNKIQVSMVGPENWNDYSKTDVVIGIRGFDSNKHDQKPPTKLFNAWAAGVPFIGGVDSAYEQVGIDGVNYLKVADKEELINTVGLLMDSPELRNKLITNGRLAFQNYNNHKITDCWINILNNEDSYFTWKSQPLILRKLKVYLRAGYFNWLRVKRRYLLTMKKY